MNINCPRDQHINNTVCFWPREKFISTSEDTKYKSGKIKRNKPLCHQKPGQKPTVSRKDTKKRREIRRLHMNNSLSQLIRNCKLIPANSHACWLKTSILRRLTISQRLPINPFEQKRPKGTIKICLFKFLVRFKLLL